MPFKPKDKTGEHYGRLTVIRSPVTDKRQGLLWLCKCDCGNITLVATRDLRHKKRAGVKSCGCLSRKPDGISARNTIYKSYKYAAKKRGLEWGLTMEQFETLVKQNCVYCNLPPSIERKTHAKSTGGYIYNGIDRINNDRGYTIDNCAPCCCTCNRAKQRMSVTEFFGWIKRICGHCSLLALEEYDGGDC